jgi:xanthine dehydrogenase small subunit
MEKLISFYCNNELVSVQVNPSITLLDFLRNQKKLTGTKEGCREGDCGACTVMLGSLINGKVKYKTVNSCLYPIADVNGKHVVSIEGLNSNELNFIQAQFVDEGGTQCGFCTPGFIISLTNYFVNHTKYSAEDAVAALDGNICRCTGYIGIKRAINNTINYLSHVNNPKKNSIALLIGKNILPQYFSLIPTRLKELHKKNRSFTNQKLIKINIIAGGTDLYVQRWESLLEEDNYFISEEPGLKLISIKQNRVSIGCAVTVEELIESKIIQKYFPFLKMHLELFGSLPIRNRATIAGNIVNASPIGDITNIFLALGANVHLKDKNKKRVVPLNEFYLGYKILNKNKNELVEYVSIPIPGRNFLFNYEKVSRRTYLDIASVNSSISIAFQKGKIKEALLSAGGVAPIPLYLKSTSDYLLNKKINNETINKAVQIANSEISPISDARGSKEYKALLLSQLIKAHFIKLFPEINFDEVIK